MLLSNSVRNPKDENFEAFRDEERLKEQRNFIETLWKKYKHYADSHFKNEFSSNFTERFWEMYLGCTLMELGFSISSKNYGPDIRTTIEGKTIWFEAVSPGPGEGDDAVPNLNYIGTFPESQLILRFTSVIWDKYKKLKKYIAEGIVDKKDGFIIAINSSKIPLAISEGYPPYILKALFPLGYPIITLDLETMKPVKIATEFRPKVNKESGTKIDTLFFENDDFCEISGILYSRANPFYTILGQDFFLIHNPNALNPIPFGSLKIGKETYTDDEYIEIKCWN